MREKNSRCTILKARLWICLFILHSGFCTLHSFAEYIRVGIFSNVNSTKYVFIAGNTDYVLIGDQKKSLLIKKDESVSFELSGDLVAVKYKGTVIGKFSKIKCTSALPDCFFRIKSADPLTQAWPFPDNLELTVSKGKLKIVNVVDLEKYVGSVVESEVGDNANLEFLKLQAVMCRTFVLGHRTRHIKEGFMVCDREHCQVFRAKSRFNELIQKAVEETKGIILTDSKGQLITGAFHSNCGGQTMNAQDAWSTSLPYLASITDTFCLHSPHATWQITIDKKSWIEYLKKKNVEVADSALSDSSFALLQPSRQVDYHFSGKTIPLKAIRNDFKLKSTWFNIFPQGDSLLFQGFGYGHGVGLCQEGAMKMADYGFKMEDIVNLYFKNIFQRKK